ncbi:MAG: antirepressor [Candidatus Firestonebacteria bacterium RIFOXYC2_FULL_39_67]|nr:MAG: antirepressor [Candidatus Firestonebacteria bacterium RIFOXYD2_FULL_39_29]OGF55536.1 MAG: antirepressor [Candidatus Firestonebacteria bacterium RIFOXYC2_FULL_39_67]OGF57929.1 MAG: antirepressor [Candidatus Firestonebacteria bacterium RifOxyC12_full_39_7]
MNSDKNLIQFEGTKIRRHWDKQKEKWYFSVVDVVGVLSESNNPAVYWRVLKKRLLDEGSNETVTKCNGLKMVAADGKMRETDIADTETMFRIIQSIPSPKAEPFKQWLAKVGYERLQDMGDPARSVDRGRLYWQQQGRSDKWIQQRMMGQETRNKLTDYWKDHKIIREEEYAFLTNIIHKEWAGVTVKKHKEIKKLKTQNLRDHMSEAELIFTALAELSTRQIAETVQADGLVQNTDAAKKGGKIAKHARLQLEEKTGKSIITEENFLPPAGLKKKIKK